MAQDNQRDLLEPYITNLNDQVFSIVNLGGLVGAVMARYSRAETGLRETLLREFIKEDKLQLEKADKLIEKVLIAYGDDSVGELEGAHLAMEEISMLATKVIEHRRIGGSPIEKSTRYVRFDQKDEHGAYLYVIPTGLTGPIREAFVEIMDQIFDGYVDMWKPIHRYLETIKPLDEAVYIIGGRSLDLASCASAKQKRQFNRTYENDLKTKTCDILRSFLPLSTKANVGIFGNGRFFQHLISKMMSSPLEEARLLGEKSLIELSKVIPHYVKRAKKNEYLVSNHQAMKDFVLKFFSDAISPETLPEGSPELVTAKGVELDYEAVYQQVNQADSAESLRQMILEQEENSFLAALVYPYCCMPFETIRKRIQSFSPDQKNECYRACYGNRETRRDRPERVIEFGYPHQFELVTEWAVYKDLMRHRMGTALIQTLDPYLGFQMPVECEAAGVLEKAEKMVNKSIELYRLLAENSPENREYAILHGHRMRWLLGMNDRALMHMLELRTTPQGHPNYRQVSQEIHRLMQEKVPKRASEMGFVNHDPVFWSRADSEARQREKEDQLGGV